MAPYDALIADEALSEEQLRTALGAAAMWTTSHAVPLLPYSCVVLESVPEAEARARMPPPWPAASPPLAQVLPVALCCGFRKMSTKSNLVITLRNIAVSDVGTTALRLLTDVASRSLLGRSMAVTL
jgi:hypothetical protein